MQVRSDRATGAGELVKFGQPVWYRFSFKTPLTGRRTSRRPGASPAAP